ncbi:MAG TPA: hypothetical protein VIF84_01820 [Candidatus Limnocylindrales bacterium]
MMDLADLRRVLEAAGVDGAVAGAAGGDDWAAGPGTTFGAHRHDHDKVLVCRSGSITFVLPEDGSTTDLVAGQRLDLPARTLHRAVVGTGGVQCVELHLPAGTLARLLAGETRPVGQ